jgi:hypothetical protein
MKTKTIEIQKHDNVTSVAASPLQDLGLPQLHQPFEPPALPPPPPDLPRAFAIESLKRKQRADSFFHSITYEQQDKLIELLHTEENLVTVFERVTAPPPQGLGLKVHLNSLRRLRAHFNAVVFADRNHEILDEIDDMEANTHFSCSHRIQEGINQLLHEKAFELARSHPASDVLRDVLASIAKLAELSYKREKLLIERQKLLRLAVPLPQHHRVDLNIVPPRPPSTSPIDPSQTPTGKDSPDCASVRPR